MPFFTERWGNPSSAYGFGSQTVHDVARARRQLAQLLRATPQEIIFTSCGTESNNTALHSALSSQPGKRHLVTTAVEHSAILNYCRWLEREGVQTTFLPVDGAGQLDPRSVEEAIRPDTALVSVMSANNETGVLFPVAEIGAICRRRGVPFHTDAVQAAGKLPLDVAELGADYLSLSAHKLNAPKGIGLLYVKRQAKFQPLLVGGHQERNRRGGTENVPYIVGFGRAAELALERLQEENTRVRRLRDLLESVLLATLPNARVNGGGAPRLPNTLNISFEHVEAEALLMLLDQENICASSGSACTTGSLEPSHVLTAMGLSPRPSARQPPAELGSRQHRGGSPLRGRAHPAIRSTPPSVLALVPGGDRSDRLAERLGATLPRPFKTRARARRERPEGSPRASRSRSERPPPAARARTVWVES